MDDESGENRSGTGEPSTTLERLAVYYLPHIEAALRGDGDINAGRCMDAPALSLAVILDRLDLVDQLLVAGADPNAVGPFEWRPLLNVQSPEAVRRLVAAGADVNASITLSVAPIGRFKQLTALIHTAGAGRHAVVRELLAMGADPNRRDGNGQNALMRATFAGHTEIVRDLIDGGATVGLTEAAVLGDTVLVRELLTTGADLHADWLNEALWWAAGRDNAAVLALLLDAGADIATSHLESGYTPLHRAASAHNLACVALLLARGADIHARDQRGGTALHAGIRRNSASAPASVVEMLLRAGAEVDAVNHSGGTALRDCARGGDTASARILLAYGASVEPQSPTGTVPLSRLSTSPLRAAVFWRQTAMVELLLEAGADAPSTLAWVREDEAQFLRSRRGDGASSEQILALLTRYAASSSAPY